MAANKNKKNAILSNCRRGNAPSSNCCVTHKAVSRNAHKLVAGLLGLIASVCHADDYDLYLLFGQSNMEGYGDSEILAPELVEVAGQAMIFHGNAAPDGLPPDGRGIWQRLRPGHGVGFESDGTSNRYSASFGLEIPFAARMVALRPGTRIAIVKYARGGTALDPAANHRRGAWSPAANAHFRRGSVNQWGHALEAYRRAVSIRDIDGDGAEDQLTLRALLWMQGERDANARRFVANRYQTNLEELAAAVRRVGQTPDLPILVGSIFDSGRDPSGVVMRNASLVVTGQQLMTLGDPDAYFIRLDNYGFVDRYHFDGLTLLALGREFADVAADITLQ